MSKVEYCDKCGWIKQQCTCEKLVTNEFTLKEVPFSWNDNLSEIALEDFSMIQSRLSYGACQSIGMALAKLKLLEEQGCEVKGEK